MSVLREWARASHPHLLFLHLKTFPLSGRALYSMHTRQRAPGFLGTAHQTLMWGASRIHKDTKKIGLESKVAFTLGRDNISVSLPPRALPACGSCTPPLLSSCVFPVYGVQTLLGAIGGGVGDGDVEMSDASDPKSCHGNLGTSWRGAYLRSREAIYSRGGSLCDHEQIGSDEWIASIRAEHGLSLRDCWAAAAANGILVWYNLSPAERQQYRQQLNVPRDQCRAVATGINPLLAGR